ncbi:Txe/YoeB family addiction module toxin [Levilactobacillus yiduensis]|uniref:Txe/YoeB family addiction module toxin n=1 Tax=Levilactobacillus yiduensis TaxID=2953880 RepID=UPI000EF2C554|nr:Txe/YoeB family addiction module toxin [Levilactobacillus yiduensis]AYM02298.1 Txe/YoeB family addiction module toxin [Levilactobacillus brevis]
MIKAWTDEAWDDYMYWHQQNDKQMIKRINKLVRDIERHPFEGLGKPEPLKHELTNLWSRRITQEHRLVYQVVKDNLYIISARNHY